MSAQRQSFSSNDVPVNLKSIDTSAMHAVAPTRCTRVYHRTLYNMGYTFNDIKYMLKIMW